MVIEGLETRVLLASDLTITSWTEFKSDADLGSDGKTYTLDGHKKVTLAGDPGNWNTNGQSFGINAGEVEIATSIDTCSTPDYSGSSDCGDIDVEARKSIIVDKSVTLNAMHTGTRGTDGDIKLHIKNRMEEFGNIIKVANQLEELIGIFDQQRVHLSIGDDVQIKGGKIDISTDSGNFQNDIAPWLNDQLHKVWKIIAATQPLPSSLIGFPITFQDWAPESIIQVGSGAVEISSLADQGDFKLRITNPHGATRTTNPISFNASASDVQWNINALNFQQFPMKVTVTGEGTTASPWHIDGLGVNNVEVVHAHLRQNDNSVELNVRAASNTTASNTYIVGSQNVTIQADTYTSAIGKAVNSTVFNPLEIDIPKFWSIGLFVTDATASIDLYSAVVSSQQDITVATKVDNKIGLTTKSLRNTGASPTDPTSFALSLALSEQKTTSTIYVDAQSLISSAGAVSVTATGFNDNSTSATAAVYRDGSVGLAPALSYGCGLLFNKCSNSSGKSDATNVTVTIDGDINANVSEPSTGATNPPTLNTTFNPAFDVNIPASKLTLPGTLGYKTGDAVVLTNDLAAALPGLPAGLYYLIVHDNGDNSYDLQFAATADDARANNYLPFGIPYPTLFNPRTELSVPVTLTATDTQQRSLILFGYENGPDGDSPIFNDGDTVTFHASNGRFLGYQNANGALVPLADGATYQVQIVESQSTTYPLSIQLLDASNKPLDLYGGSYLESESGGVRYPISAIDTDSGQIDVRQQALDSSGENVVYSQPVNPIAQGAKLVFHSGLSQDSVSLQDGNAYWAIVDPNNPGLIQLAISEAQAEAADPSVQDAVAHLTAVFQGLQIPLTNGLPNGLQDYQTFSITVGSTTQPFAFASSNLMGPWAPGTIVVNLVNDSAESQAAEIINAIGRANLGLQPSYEGSGKIAIGTQKDLSFQTENSALQVVNVAVDLPIGNFESGVGLVFSEDPRLVDNLPVTYHAVLGKPMGGLVDGGAYYVYNVNNSNYNPAVPQYILTLMNAVEISSSADSGSFALRITAPDGSVQTTPALSWNVSADDLAAAVNGLALQGVSVQVSGTGQSNTPWFIDGLNVDAVTLVNSSLMQNASPVVPNIREAAPETLMASAATDGTFTLEVRGADGSQGITGDLAWNLSAAQLQAAIAGLNLAGVDATVEGSGTYEDPWLIHGLNPSQIIVDSSKLLLGQDPTNMQITSMQMTSARQVVFYYGQTLDDAGGTAYAISGADRDNGTLTILLTDTAPVVAADGSQLTSDGVGTAGVSFAEVPDGAFEFYSFAADGTFTLTVADSSGNTQTTSDLPYNATPDQIAAALNALAGVAVSVTGMGTIGSPWMVSGLSLDQVTADSNLLDSRGDATDPVAQPTSGGMYRVWVDHAQGGTFTLTLHAAGQDVTTAALSFDEGAGELTSALRELVGVNEQVTGAGTSTNPWILRTWSQPIRSGDPLVFHDSWGMAGLGMIDGRTYYAIVMQQGFDPQEITLQLAATPADAANASSDLQLAGDNQHIEMRPYLPLDPAGDSWFPTSQETMLGVPTSNQNNNGITISATLDTSNSVGSYANLGGFPLLSYAFPPGRSIANNFQKQNEQLNAEGQSWIEELIARRAGDDVDKANEQEFVGAAAAQWVSNNVQVIIGRTAEIGTNGPLTISSDITQSISAVSNAGLSKTNSGNENWAVAVSFALTNVTNTSQALVSSDAVISGGNGVDVESHITYVPPAHWPVFRQVQGAVDSYKKANVGQIIKNIFDDLETVFKDVFLGDLGLLTANFNTVANVGIARVGGAEDNNNDVMNWVVTGSFAYEIISNNNLAQIADGAKVNLPGRTFKFYDPDLGGTEANPILKAQLEKTNQTQIVGFRPGLNTQLEEYAQMAFTYQDKTSDWITVSNATREIDIVKETLVNLLDIDADRLRVSRVGEYEWSTEVQDSKQQFDQIGVKTRNIPNVKIIASSTAPAPLEYGVSIVANTTTPQWGLAGQLYFSVPYMIHGLLYGGQGSKLKQAWREGGPFRSAAKNAAGGSVSLLTMDGSTQALLGGSDADGPVNGDVTDPTEVHYGTGTTGGLRIEATTNNGVVQVAQAAANSSEFGFEGSVAYVAMGEPHATVKPDDRRQKTYAKMISRNVPLAVQPIDGSDGGIDVKATDLSFGWAITGSIMIGQSKGIGLSGSVVELTRDVQASIGSQYNSTDPYRTSGEWEQVDGSEIQSNGSITVDANVDGTVVPLSLVGEAAVREGNGGGVNGGGGNEEGGNEEGGNEEGGNEEGGNEEGGNEEGGGGPWYQLFANLTALKHAIGQAQSLEFGISPSYREGQFGVFISGDFSAAFIDDMAYGYVNVWGDVKGDGDLTNEKLTITSRNSTTVNPGAGGIALQWAKSNSNDQAAGGFAGSMAWASVQSDVRALLDSSTVSGFALYLVAENNKRIGSGAAGLQVDSPTGFDLQVAGSVVINSLSNTTIAAIRNSTQTDMGNLSIKAFAQDEIFGLAGTGQLSFAPRSGKTVIGFGMSTVWNDTNNTTTAEIVNSQITQIQGGTNVLAEDFTTSKANSFGTQIAVTAGSVIEIGGMWTANLLFPNTTAQITGSNLTNTNPNRGTSMLVSATLAPILESFAGYFSVGVSASNKEVGQLGVGAAVVTARIGSKDDQAEEAEYKTLSQIDHSTVVAYDQVTVYALTGDLNSDTEPYVVDQSESELSDPNKDRWNVRSLAIAGGLQAGTAPLSIAAEGAFVSTRQRVDTIAQVTDSSVTQGWANDLDLTVKAVNQVTTHTDAGGGAIDVSWNSGGISIAVGGAVNQYNSKNATKALIGASTVAVHEATVSANLAPFIENIAFGVAISVTGGIAFGDSGADLHLKQSDTAEAGISNSEIRTSGNLEIKAEDYSFLKTGSGSGTLAISSGALAFGEVFNIVRVRNNVLAWLGTEPMTDRASRKDDETPTPIIYLQTQHPDTSVITVGGSLNIEATSGQTVKSTTTAVAVAGADTFAIAGSGADGKVNLANIVRAGINDVANVTVTGAGITVHAEILGVNSADSVKDRKVHATVGDIAAVGGAYGGSIGLSFGQITNDDFVVAQIENSTVTVDSESGSSSIDVIATDKRTMETKVWVTSIALALGGAGAGGHSFIYSQPIVIAEVGHGSQIIPKNDSQRGDLSVIATGQESLHAGIFGGVAGVVAIGDFIAETDKHGIVGAILGTVGTLHVRNLAVEAKGNHDLDAHGWSLSVGALSISGDGHKLTYDEQIVAYAGGDISISNSTANCNTGSGTTTVDASADVSISATSSTIASSNAGQKPSEDNHSGSGGIGAIGFFKSNATYSPSIATQTTQLDLTYRGNLNLTAQTSEASSKSRAVTASGSVVGADFTKAFNTIKPISTLTIDNSSLKAASNSTGMMSLHASNDILYDTYAYTFAITVFAGGSGARVFNEFEPTAKVTYSGKNTITSGGTVDVVTHNAWKRIPDKNDGSSGLFNDDDSSNSSQGVGFGVIAEDAATVGSGNTENTDAAIVQHVGFDAGDNGEITGGTFTLTYAGQTTKPLDYNAKEKDVQEALEDLKFITSADSNYLSDRVTVNRIDSSKHKMQWKITFSEGLGTQQVTIDTSNLIMTGTVMPIQSTDPLPWSYSGTSKIDFGTSTTEINGLDPLKPVDVTWLATQSVDLKEFASQHINGLFGKAYAKSTVAVNTENKILLDQANVTMDSGINQFTVAAGVDLDITSRTSARHPVLGGGTSQAVVVVNATNHYEDKPYNEIDQTGTSISAGSINLLIGGTAGDWNQIQHPIANSFTPQIKAVAEAGTTGNDYISSSVINQWNIATVSGTIYTDATSNDIKVVDQDTSDSYAYFAANGQTGFDVYHLPVFLLSDGSSGLYYQDANFRFGLPHLNLGVDDQGVTVNGKFSAWDALNPSNSVNYQDFVSSPDDSLDQRFTPFVAGRSLSVETALGEIMDTSSLNTFRQNYAVPQEQFAYLLQHINVPQASVRIVADHIEGTGTIAAHVPKLNITNNTSGWLILDGISSATNRNAGQVLLLDSQGDQIKPPPGLVIQSNSDPEKNIDISVNPPSAATGSQPFMIVAGYLNAPSSNVTLTNDYGPIIELAPIRAESVTINAPNSAFAVYTPDYYFGIGGDSRIAFNNETEGNSGSVSNQPFIPAGASGTVAADALVTDAVDYVGGGVDSTYASGSTDFLKNRVEGSITAAQIAIFAKTIDINAPLKVGKSEDLSVTLSSDLGNQFRDHKAAYESGSTSNPLLVIYNVCKDSSDVTATYDARTNQITLSSITLSQNIRALLDGHIVSTVKGSTIQLGGGIKPPFIKNETGIPLILNNLDAGSDGVSGIVEFRDTATQTNTKYVYSSSAEAIEVFTAPRGQNYSNTPDDLLNAKTTNYQPDPNTYWVSAIKPDLVSTPATSNWTFGDDTVFDFTDFVTVNTASVVANSLSLTQSGKYDQSNAAWLREPVDVTRSFLVTFKYHSGNSISRQNFGFALQTEGTSVSQPYQSAMEGKDAVFLFNNSDQTAGFGDDTNSYTQSKLNTNNDLFVTLRYDVAKHEWSATLLGSELVRSLKIDINLEEEFGSMPVYAGLTGSTGPFLGINATGVWGQTISDFRLTYDPADAFNIDTEIVESESVLNIPYLESTFVKIPDPTLDGFSGFVPAGSLPANAITPNQVTFSNVNSQANAPRAAWYGDMISTDVDTFTIEFDYQANLGPNPKVEGFSSFVPASTSYSSKQTSTQLELTSGNTNEKSAFWLQDEINTSDDFNITFTYENDASTVQGFSSFVAPTNSSNAATITSDEIALTNGAASIARAAWLKDSVPTNYGFTIEFTYQASGNRDADGIALVFQTQGTNVVGNTGGGLGYVGIAGNKAAYQINIFGGNGQTKGSNFVTTNSSGTYNNTNSLIGGVNFSNGNPIKVRLTYDQVSQQLFESLTDIINNNTYTYTYSGINLASTLGTSQAYIGFTGSSGARTAIQTVKGFSFRSHQADGIALVFQNQGANAIGDTGGSLGYVGIAGNKAAYQINVFSGDSKTVGSNFVTTNSSGTYHSTGSVKLDSGHPIQVQLAYNSHTNQLTETLKDLVTNTTYTKTYNGINLSQLLGPTTYVGFTGGSGSLTAIQSVQDFSMEFFPDDGLALVFQSAGTNASGNVEDGLGYVGISGPTAAYQINLKNNASQGTNFVTTNTAGTYVSTGDVSFVSGHPIHVSLTYDNKSRRILESLTDLSTGQTFSRYHLVDLPVLGPIAYVGFTAPNGGKDTVQTVKNFKLSGKVTNNDFRQRFFAAPVSQDAAGTTTSYATDFRTWVRADYPIAVDFNRISTSKDLHVNSNASLVLNGLIRVADLLTLTSTGGSITTTSTGSLTGRTVSLDSQGNGGFIGTVGSPINVSLTKTATQSGFLTANGVSGVYIDSPGDITVGYISTWSPDDNHDGPVVLDAIGDIVSSSASSLIFAGKLSMTSGGAIGSISSPLNIQLVPNNTLDGSIVAGLLNAQADGDISLFHFGDVRVGKVKSPGTVSLTTHDGNILDGLTLDALGLSDPTLSPPARNRLYQFLTAKEPDRSDESIALLEANINAQYPQYWQLIPATNYPTQPPVWNNWDPGDWGDIVTTTDSDGNSQQVYQLTTEGLDGLRPRVWVADQVETLIAVPGGSFEIPDLQDGEQGSLVDWDLVSGGGYTTISHGVRNPLDAQYAGATGDNADLVAPANGSQYAYIRVEPGDSESFGTLSVTNLGVIELGMRYELVVALGNSLDANPGDISIDLTADGITFASTSISAADIAEGQFSDFSLIYTTIGHSDANVGKQLGVAIRMDAPIGTDAAPLEVGIDNIRLRSTKVLASDSEVQDYANQIWQNCAATFADPQAFGPGWESLPQFQQYDPAYQFTASEETIAYIKAFYQESFNIFSYLSSQALAHPSEASSIEKLSNIEAGNLILMSSGSIGQNPAPVDIPLEHFQNDTLTDEQRAIIRFASQAGEIQMIGQNASGETIYYQAGSPPENVTLTGVRITIARPLLVQVAPTGSLTANSSSELLVFGTAGDLRVNHATSSGNGYIWLESARDLLVADDSTGATVSGGAMRFNAGGAIGTSSHPLIIAAVGQVDLSSLADAWLESTKALQLGAWNVQGALNLQVDGSAAVTDARAEQRSSFAGFNTNGSGWTATDSQGSQTVTSGNADDALTLMLNSGMDGTSTWPSQIVFAKNDPVQLSDHFTFGFFYQSSATGSRVALDLGHADQSGLALLLNLGNADGSGAWADFVNSSQIATTTSGQSLGSVVLNSNHPIEVTITYSLLTQTVLATLTDTVTKAVVSIEQQDVNLIQRLGGRSAQIAWQALGDGVTASTHTIHGFRLIDGPVNLTAESLNAVAGGAFGAPASGSQPLKPILLLIRGETQIHAGGAIVAEQVLGDLQVGAIVSPTTTVVTAPFGAVVQYVPPSDGGSGEGEVTLTGVVAPAVYMTAFFGIGSGDVNLNVVTDHFSASAGADVNINHQAFDAQQPSAIAKLTTDGKIDFRSDSDLSVTGIVTGQQATFHSIAAGKLIRLALAGLSDHLGGRLAVLLNGFVALHVDDAQATEGHSVTVAANTVDTHAATIVMGVAKSLGLEMGAGHDVVTVQDASGLASLSVQGGQGDDKISIANAALAIQQLIIDGDLGDEVLNIDLRNTGAWVTQGGVETAFGKINFSAIKQVVLDRLETLLGPEAIEKIELEIQDFPAQRLLIVGTAGPDSIAVTDQATKFKVNTLWNGVTGERRTYANSEINEVRLYMLGGDDFVSVVGSMPQALEIYGGRGNDWINVQNVPATITDLHGDNTIWAGDGDDFIHTGPGDDQITVGGGKNQIVDDGGMNSITTGDQNDQIHHANPQDWIVAGAGVNDIWLNEDHQGWHNAVNPVDVNRDGSSTILDLLLIINLINQQGSHVLLGSADSVAYLVDTNDDVFLSPIDALIVINHINRQIAGDGEAVIDPTWESDSGSTFNESSSHKADPEDFSLAHGAAITDVAIDACFAALDHSENYATWYEEMDIRRNRRKL